MFPSLHDPFRQVHDSGNNRIEQCSVHVDGWCWKHCIAVVHPIARVDQCLIISTIHGRGASSFLRGQGFRILFVRHLFALYIDRGSFGYGAWIVSLACLVYQTHCTIRLVRLQHLTLSCETLSCVYGVHFHLQCVAC